MSNEQKQPPQGGNEQRSENLLPADDNSAADGRFDVAEEVNLDQQSDATRHVGQAPKGIAQEGLAESLKDSGQGGSGGGQGGDA